MRSLPDRAKKWILSALSVGFSLLICELCLRWDPPFWVYMEARNIVQQTTSEPSPNPLLGYLPKANLERRFRNKEFNMMVKINSRNMRDKEYPYQKLPGAKRIVAVGDTFAFGWGVEVDETVTELLETKYLKDV